MATAAVTGTGATGLTEAKVKVGADTIIVTLSSGTYPTGDKWIAAGATGISILNSEHFDLAATNTGTQACTVPSGTNCVVVCLATYDSTANFISAQQNSRPLFDGVSMTAGNVQDSSTSAQYGGIWWIAHSTSGSKNFEWDFAGTSTPDVTPVMYVVYLSGVDTTALRNNGGQQAVGGTYTTGSLTGLTTGDQTIGFTWGFNGTAVAWTTGTEQREDTSTDTNIIASLMYHSPTTATTYQSTITAADDGGISVIVLKPA